MEYYLDEIKRIRNEFSDCLDSYSVELENMPIGHLICCRNGSIKQYVRIDTSSGKYKREYINRNPTLIRQLARKEFLNRSVKALRTNVNVLDRALQKMEIIDPDYIIGSMHRAYRELPHDHFFEVGSLPLHASSDTDLVRRIERHREWAERDYTMSNYKPEYRTKPTSRGLYVRSKSEQLIAEMLYKHGIPFRYEQVILIGTKEFSADFSFEAADGSEFFWEHAGMMDDPRYAENHLRKLISYQRADIIPGRNLLISYDRDGDLNMATVESMIKNEVIPRL